MNNESFTSAAKELRLKAVNKDLQDKLMKATDELAACSNSLSAANAQILELTRRNEELSAQNNFLSGQVDAYEKVLSHMIYQDSGLADEDCEDCEHC